MRKEKEFIEQQVGKGTFVKAHYTAFSISKVLLDFVSFDTQTNKQLCSIPIYIDFKEMHKLIHDVESGTLIARCNAEKGNQGYPKALFEVIGGTTKKHLRTQRADGKDECRIFSLVPGLKADIMMQAVRGAGEETAQGIIKPSINYKDKTSYETIQVPFSYEDLIAMVSEIKMFLYGYNTSQWMKGAFEKPYEAKSVGTQTVPATSKEAPQTNPKSEPTKPADQYTAILTDNAIALTQKAGCYRIPVTIDGVTQDILLLEQSIAYLEQHHKMQTLLDMLPGEQLTFQGKRMNQKQVQLLAC